MKKHIRLIFPIVALAFLVLGCGLISGIFSFDHEIRDFRTSSPTALDEGRWDKVHVNLYDNPDYEDHRDKLKGVESVCLVMDVENHLEQSVSGEVWIAYKEFFSKEGVQDSGGVRIFSGIALGPSEKRHFGCGDIETILENLDAFEDAVRVGDFWVYGFGNEDEYDVTFSHIVFIINLAVGL
jgi:hypothetical protein